MEESKCIICGSPDYKVVFPENKAQIHRIVKCSKCGLMYANPQSHAKIEGKVSLEQLNDPEGKDDDSQTYEQFVLGLHNYITKQTIQLKDYRKSLNVLKKLNFSGSLFEIGAFTGNFLKEAENYGWKVSGIEPMVHAVTYAKKNLGIDLIPKPFEVADIPAHSYDAVCNFHVIEHVYDPVPFVTKVAHILKKDGVFVTETPCYDTLIFKILRHRERSVRCNGHLFFFTKKSLKDLMEKCGFRVIKFERVGRTLSLARLLINFDIIIGRKNKPFFSRLNDKFNLEKITFTFNMRDMQRMYCTPA